MFGYALRTSGIEALEVYATQLNQAAACTMVEILESTQQILSKEFKPDKFKKANAIAIDGNHGSVTSWISWANDAMTLAKPFRK